MTTIWRMLMALMSVLLMATSAWAQEKPRLGFKDIYLGMPKEALRPIWEESCREGIKRGYSRWREDWKGWSPGSPPKIRSEQEQLALCLAEPELSLPQRYWKVGSISVITPTVVIKDEKVGGIRFTLLHSDFKAMEAALTQKYGAPLLRTVEVVKNKLGAEFNSEVLTWELKDGTMLMKERSHSLDISEVLIASYAFLDATEKERKSRAKKDAEGL